MRVWIEDSSGSHTSQHFLDPYSVTHVEHGLLFYGVLVLSATRVSRGGRWTIALAAEALWEVAENARFIVERYRQGADADYFGDSAVNVLGDMAACAIGYALAEQLGKMKTLGALAAIELALVLWIRDSLFLNIVMLVYPIEAVKQWQQAVS